ncbi:MAG: Lrp/AsnC family transcriptional regulator [Candidatus Hydrothermarchaeota archaeon]
MIAFVEICTELGKEKDVAEELKKVEEVKELFGAFGDLDIIAKVEADDIDAIAKVVLEKIRTIDGVNETKTIITIPL